MTSQQEFIAVYSILRMLCKLPEVFWLSVCSKQPLSSIIKKDKFHRYSGYTSSHGRCSVKKVFLEISQNSQENNCARVPFQSLLTKSQSLRPATLLKFTNKHSQKILIL